MVLPRSRRLVPAAAVAFVALAGCGALGAPATAPLASGVEAWGAGAPAPFALTEVAAAGLDGRIWVAGGMDAGGAAVTTVAIFEPAVARWTDGPALPEPVHHAALVATPLGLLLVGGYRADGQATDAVRRLDLSTGTWVPGPSLPEPRAAGAAAASGDGVIYAGGVGPAGVQVEVFRLDGDAWRVVGRLPIPREHVAAAADDVGRVFVLGGRQGGLDSNQSVVDVVEGESVRTVGSVPTRRGGVGAFWWPSLGACLVGGESPGGTNPQVECIDGNGRVTGLPDLARPRHGLGAAVVGRSAWALLGGERPGLFVSDAVEELRLP